MFANLSSNPPKPINSLGQIHTFYLTSQWPFDFSCTSRRSFSNPIEKKNFRDLRQSIRPDPKKMLLCNLHGVSNGSATFRPWRCGHHHPPFWNESWGAGESSITKWRSRLDEWSIDNHGNLKVSSTKPDLIHGICAKLVTEIGCSSQVWHGVPSTSPPAVRCRSAQIAQIELREVDD